MHSGKFVLGDMIRYDYDEQGNKIRETDPLGNVTEYGYDADGNEHTVTTKRTGADGSEIVMTIRKDYDNKNRIIKETDPDGYFTETEYDPVTGKKSAFTDKKGNRTEYGYDDQGNLLETAYPDGKTISHSYDEEGNVLSTSDRAGHTTRYQYDPVNHVMKITHPNGKTMGMEYDAAGLSAIIDENNNQTLFEWNAAGKRTKITDALGNVTRLEYDANGNEKHIIDAKGNTVTYEYDALNRRIRTTFPDGTFTQVTYYGDSEDKKTSETDQADNTIWFEYDESGRLAKVTDVLGGETLYEYDGIGNKISQTDPNGNTKYWEYDNSGRVVKHILPEGKSETYVYDPNGNLVEKTDFNGDTIEYEYDGYNRLTKKIYPDETEVSFTYIANGRRQTITDARGVTEYVYNAMNQLEKVTNPDGTEISYTYDAKGNRTSVTVPSGKTDYTYDALNRLKTVIAPDGGVTTYTYDKVGSRESVTYPNGVVAEYMYNRLNRLIKLENRNGTGDLISGYVYTLGPAGNREQVEELHTGRVVKYVYDELHRLTTEQITDPVLGNETLSYTYDVFGNRLTKSDSGGMITYSYNGNDELETETGPGHSLTYGYDDNGNAVSKNDGTGDVIFGYDYENRMVSAGSAAYIYDADGIRVRSIADGSATDYLVDKNRQYAQVLEQRDESGAVSYVYGDDLISRKQDGEIHYYVYDGHGSVRQLTDAAGTVTDSYIYDAFGNLRDHTGSADNRYLYAGEQYDPDAGLYYLRARYYDPENGRFMTHDPYVGNPHEPVTLHRYLYANANPVTYIDPSGKFGVIEMLETTKIMSILSFAGLAWGVANAADSYLSLVGKKTITWTGRLFVFTNNWPGHGWGGFGIIRAQLFSEAINGKKIENNYMLFLMGVTVALPPFSFSGGGIEMETPSVRTLDKYTLQGPCSWLSATLSPLPLRGKGISLSLISMGEGRGKIEVGAVDGYDYGVDLMGGYSWWIPGSWGDAPF